MTWVRSWPSNWWVQDPSKSTASPKGELPKTVRKHGETGGKNMENPWLLPMLQAKPWKLRRFLNMLTSGSHKLQELGGFATKSWVLLDIVQLKHILKSQKSLLEAVSCATTSPRQPCQHDASDQRLRQRKKPLRKDDPMTENAQSI